MKASRRNIVIAVVLLAVLLVLPFWPKIRQALAPAAGEEVSCTVTVACQAEALPELRAAGVALEADGTLFSTPCTVTENSTVLEALKTAAKAAGLPGDHPGQPRLRHRHRGLGCRGPWGGLGLDLYRQRRDGDGQLRHTDGPGGGPDSVDLCDRLDLTATRPGRAAEERVRVFPQAPERGGGDFCETNQTGDGPAVWPAGPGGC